MKLKESPEDFVVEEIPISFSDEGEYLIVKLIKRELNSEDAALILAKAFGVPRKNLGYAGAKDKQAVTTQYVSIKGVSQEKVLGFSHEKITLEYVGKHNTPLSLGDLLGNRFTIVVRELEEPLVAKEKVRNYFGPQRFGHNNQNAVIGRHIIKKEFKEACQLLELPVENPIKHLSTLPKHLLMLYVHSYQSWLWNTVLEHLDNPPSHLPMIGFGTELEDEPEEVRHQYEQLLELEGISQRDFIIRQLNNISPEGASRQCLIDVQDLVLGEFSDGVQKVSFRLQKGSYATTVLNQFAQQ